MRPSSAHRAGRRALAALGAVALGAVGAASPAAAQDAPPTVVVDIPDTVRADSSGHPATLDIGFGDDWTSGEHDVTALITADEGVSLYPYDYNDDGRCRTTVSGGLDCLAEDADDAVLFEFGVTAYTGTEPGEYGYAVAVEVDGEEVASVEGSFTVAAPPGTGEAWHPYLHSDTEHTGAAAGETVAVRPAVLQDRPLPDETAAVAAVFNGTDHFHAGDVMKVTAGYDNCLASESAPFRVTCLITDVEDSPGGVLRFTDPISYTVASDAPGPFAFCGCDYSVFAVHSEDFETEYGGVFWDEDSDDLLGLSADDAEGPFEGAGSGGILIETAENPFDLAVADADIEGNEGDQVPVTVPVTNEGPAATYGVLESGPGSYVLLGDLPDGVEMHWLESDTGNAGEWFCIGERHWEDMPEWDLYLADVDRGELDFACFFDRFAVGERFDFKFHVVMTDPDSTDVGRLEIRALDDGEYPGLADADPSNDRSALTVNGNGSARLPSTGPPLALVLGAAAAALAAGVPLFALTRRRTTGAAPDA